MAHVTFSIVFLILSISLGVIGRAVGVFHNRTPRVIIHGITIRGARVLDVGVGELIKII